MADALPDRSSVSQSPRAPSVPNWDDERYGAYASINRRRSRCASSVASLISPAAAAAAKPSRLCAAWAEYCERAQLSAIHGDQVAEILGAVGGQSVRQLPHRGVDRRRRSRATCVRRAHSDAPSTPETRSGARTGKDVACQTASSLTNSGKIATLLAMSRGNDEAATPIVLCDGRLALPSPSAWTVAATAPLGEAEGLGPRGW